MKKISAFIAVLVLLVSLCSFSAFADSGGYTIKDYDVKAVLHENNTVSVTETIKINFSQSRHGIYRELPLEMRVGKNVAPKEATDTLLYENYVKDVNVEGWNYETDDDDGYLMIKIGSSSKYVEGDQTYKISYLYGMPDDRLKTTDFLFYSVLGNQWATTTDHLSFDFQFKKPLSDLAVKNFQVFSGTTGSETDVVGVDYKLTKNRIKGDAYNLRPYESVTFFSTFENGYFVGAKTVSPIPMYLCMGVFGFGVLLTLIFAFTAKHKEPVETVEFYPPDGITPAEVGTIIDESADDIDLMAMIPYWAQNGYIDVEEQQVKRKKKIILHAKQSLPSTAPEFEKKLWYAFFTGGTECDLSELKISFADRYKEAKNKLTAVFTGDKKLSQGQGKAFGSIFLACLGFFGTLVFSSFISTFYNFIFAVIAAVPALIFGFGCAVSLRSKKTGKKVLFILFSLVLFAVSAGACYFAADSSNMSTYVFFGMLGIYIVAALFSSRIVTDTDFRVEKLGKLRGLKNFIETAEVDRLKMLLEEDSGYYYKVLPYAMVFNLVDKWAKRFDGIPTEAPDWYYGYDNTTLFTALYLNQMLHKNIHQQISHINAQAAAEAAAKAASSSSSGGFSGGGGGGGGGGSW